jgi:hypothetical protein
MRLDIAKIDERIKKLQEIRRIASDREMMSILLECLTTDEAEITSRLVEPQKDLAEIDEFHQPTASANDPIKDEAEELLKGIATGMSWRQRRG